MGDEGAWLAPLFSSLTSSLSKEVMFLYQLLSLSPSSHRPRVTDPGGEEIHGKGHGLQGWISCTWHWCPFGHVQAYGLQLWTLF